MYNNTVTLAHGCAGTGKTLLALWFGMLEVNDKIYEKVVYIRSDVGTDHQRGRDALPGTPEENMLPFINPLLDDLSVFTKLKVQQNTFCAPRKLSQRYWKTSGDVPSTIALV